MAGKMPDQKIKLSLKSQRPEHKLRGQAHIARIETLRAGPEKIRRVASTFDQAEDFIGESSGRRQGFLLPRLYNRCLDLEKTLLRKVGEAIGRFKMIRDGDRVAVALSGGKDSLALLEALLLLEKRAPVQFSVCAFTVEQGKFLRPIEPLGEYLRQKGVAWTYYRDKPSFRLLKEQPDHGCDLCSRYRRRAVYEIARGLGANVIAFGHTADDFCEAFLRNSLFTGRLSALPAVTHSRDREFRLIRPLLFVSEEVTRRFIDTLGAPVVPCGCSQKTGTVRRALRDLFAGLEKEYPYLKENMLAAMGNLQPERLLDVRFLDLDAAETADDNLLPLFTES
jgi:tRNA 2-thiocytidine biosynthesis protein TtcA